MGFLLSISQSSHSELVTDAVVGAALAVLGLRGSASHASIGTFLRRTRGEERFVSFVKLTTSTSVSATGLHRALESALVAAELEDAQVQVLEELAGAPGSES